MGIESRTSWPYFTIGNVGKGAALQIDAHWEFDPFLIGEYLHILRAITEVPLSMNSLGSIYGKDRSFPIIQCDGEVTKPFGYLFATEDENKFSKIRMPRRILNCAALHTFTVDAGVIVKGKINLMLTYQNQMGQGGRRKFSFAYEGLGSFDNSKLLRGAEVTIYPEQVPYRPPRPWKRITQWLRLQWIIQRARLRRRLAFGQLRRVLRRQQGRDWRSTFISKVLATAHDPWLVGGVICLAILALGFFIRYAYFP